MNKLFALTRSREYRIVQNSKGDRFKVQYKRETVLSWIIRKLWVGLDNPDMPLKTVWWYLTDIEHSHRLFADVASAEIAIKLDQAAYLDRTESTWSVRNTVE